MKILVTAGATEVPIDRVRAITNIFKGRTGTEIACAFGYVPPHEVTLITSNKFPAPFCVRTFRTFDELAALMEQEVRSGKYDLVIHSAAVSDYRVTGVEALRPDGVWASAEANGKLSSAAPGMRLTLAQTPKLVEKIKREWRFAGGLVQFKLEVGITDEELIRRAKAALGRSGGDLVVANCLEWMHERALLIGADGSIENIKRERLPETLVRRFT